MALHFSDDDPSVLEDLEMYFIDKPVQWANKDDIPTMY